MILISTVLREERLWFDSESPEFVYLACHLKFWTHREMQTHNSNGSLFCFGFLLFFCGRISMGLHFIYVDLILMKILMQKILTWNSFMLKQFSFPAS